MKTRMPPLPYPYQIISYSSGNNISFWVEKQVVDYGKACYQAGVDTAIETLKCDEELVNSKAEIALLKDWIRQEGETNDTCTYGILKTICDGCKCHRQGKNHDV